MDMNTRAPRCSKSAGIRVCASVGKELFDLYKSTFTRGHSLGMWRNKEQMASKMVACWCAEANGEMDKMQAQECVAPFEELTVDQLQKLAENVAKVLESKLPKVLHETVSSRRATIAKWDGVKRNPECVILNDQAVYELPVTEYVPMKPFV